MGELSFISHGGSYTPVLCYFFSLVCSSFAFGGLFRVGFSVSFDMPHSPVEGRIDDGRQGELMERCHQVGEWMHA